MSTYFSDSSSIPSPWLYKAQFNMNDKVQGKSNHPANPSLTWANKATQTKNGAGIGFSIFLLEKAM